MRKYHSLTAVLMLAGIFSWSLMSCSVEDHEIVLQYNEHKNIVESSEFTPYMDMNAFAGDEVFQRLKNDINPLTSAADPKSA